MTKYLTILAIFILILTPLISSHTGESNYTSPCGMFGGMMQGNYGYGWGIGLIFGWLLSILFLVAMILLIVWLIKQIQKTPTKNRKRK